MDLGSASGSVAFGDETPLDPGSLILLLQKSNRTMRFDGLKKIRRRRHGKSLRSASTTRSGCSMTPRAASWGGTREALRRSQLSIGSHDCRRSRFIRP
jgi:hypothetical protein